MKPPAFWYPPADGSAASPNPLVHWGLRLLSALYQLGSRIKTARAQPFRAGVPVICIGNLTLGGTGKTPLTMMLADFLSTDGFKPHILSRGHGGALRGPVTVKPNIHVARDVGDEPLLLSRAAPVWVGHRRELTALSAMADGADVLLMDDGFQNPSLEKTLSLLVVDGEVGLGNEAVFPSGPLRERKDAGFARADALILMGPVSARTRAQIAGFDGPVFRAALVPVRPAETRGPALAFAGIGRPDKFFASLRDSGVEIAARVSFPDHHVFTEADLAALTRQAEENKLTLITTEKDFMRLPDAFREEIEVFAVKAEMTEPDAFADFILRAIGQPRARAAGGPHE